MDNLHKATYLSLPQYLIDEYEAIDVDVCQLMNETEHQCKKMYTGSIPCSPAYDAILLLLEY